MIILTINIQSFSQLLLDILGLSSNPKAWQSFSLVLVCCKGWYCLSSKSLRKVSCPLMYGLQEHYGMSNFKPTHSLTCHMDILVTELIRLVSRPIRGSSIIYEHSRIRNVICVIFRRCPSVRRHWFNTRLGYCFTPYQLLWLYNGAPLVAFYDTLGIRRTYSRLKPPASSRGTLV